MLSEKYLYFLYFCFKVHEPEIFIWGHQLWTNTECEFQQDVVGRQINKLEAFFLWRFPTNVFPVWGRGPTSGNCNNTATLARTPIQAALECCYELHNYVGTAFSVSLERRRKRERSTIFLESTREGQRQFRTNIKNYWNKRQSWENGVEGTTMGFFRAFSSVHSVQDGIYALGKAHMRSTPSRRSFLIFVFGFCLLCF